MLDEIRFRCLELALPIVGAPDQAITAARRMADFVCGGNDAALVEAAERFRLETTPSFVAP